MSDYVYVGIFFVFLIIGWWFWGIATNRADKKRKARWEKEDNDRKCKILQEQKDKQDIYNKAYDKGLELYQWDKTCYEEQFTNMRKSMHKYILDMNNAFAANPFELNGSYIEIPFTDLCIEMSHIRSVQIANRGDVGEAFFNDYEEEQYANQYATKTVNREWYERSHSVSVKWITEKSGYYSAIHIITDNMEYELLVNPLIIDEVYNAILTMINGELASYVIDNVQTDVKCFSGHMLSMKYIAVGKVSPLNEVKVETKSNGVSSSRRRSYTNSALTSAMAMTNDSCF